MNIADTILKVYLIPARQIDNQATYFSRLQSMHFFPEYNPNGTKWLENLLRNKMLK